MDAYMAIERIKKECCNCPQFPPKGMRQMCDDSCRYGENKCHYQMAINALEKQIPYKPDVIVHENDIKIGNIVFKGGTKTYKCKCGMFVTRSHKYCGNCGKELKWED